MSYMPREIEAELKRISAQFPVTLLTGPRHDSTLRLAAREDPGRFVQTLETPVIIDEVQYAPEILPFIKMRIDRNRENGAFILTGSQVFNVMAGVTESLAGRAALFELLPFSVTELGLPFRDPRSCFQQIWRGFYPVPNTEKTDTPAFYGAYLSLYIERDVRQIQNIRDISAFEIFLRLLAGRAGNLLNIADLASDCGIAPATCKDWLSILENSRIIYLLRPWFGNPSKRLIKSPKLYFTDTGLLACLLRFPDPPSLLASPAMGAVFENMIIMEFLKRKLNRRLPGDLYFYRDSNGVEVDLVLDGGSSLSLYEIKAAQTLKSGMTRTLKLASLSGGAGGPKLRKYLLSFHENRVPLGGEITALPWWEVFL